MEFNHYSVMLRETVDMLDIKPHGIYVDCTMGGGGHSLEIAKRLTTGRLIAIDQDEDAHAAAKERLSEHLDKITFIHDNFKNIRNILFSLGIEKVDGITADLGVSSYQLDTGERGFSFHIDAPLDMRMDKSKSFSAYNVVNEYSAYELERILNEYGEEKFARNIARGIEKAREERPIETTFELVDVIKASMPKAALRDKHPARRTFQAIRIEVNDEIGLLSGAVEDMINCLDAGGRIAIITFHSLEDRAVKEAFKAHINGCTCPPEFPVCTCGFKPSLELITRKPVVPSDKELEENSRSRSAKLRGAIKI